MNDKRAATNRRSHCRRCLVIARHLRIALPPEIVKLAKLIVRKHQCCRTKHRHPPVFCLPRFALLGHPVSKGLDMPPDRLGNVLAGDRAQTSKAGLDLSQRVNGNFDTAIDRHAANGCIEPRNPFAAVRAALAKGFHHQCLRAEAVEHHLDLAQTGGVLVAFRADISPVIGRARAFEDDIANTFQEFEESTKDVEVKTHKRREMRNKIAFYWGIIAIFEGRKIKVILRKIGNGQLHFWSIVPAWTTNKYRDAKFVTTMKGHPEED